MGLSHGRKKLGGGREWCRLRREGDIPVFSVRDETRRDGACNRKLLTALVRGALSRCEIYGRRAYIFQGARAPFLGYLQGHLEHAVRG